MKKEDMVCSTCSKFDGEACRLKPKPLYLGAATEDMSTYRQFNTQIRLDPVTHWCAQGEWLDAGGLWYDWSMWDD